MKKSYLVILCLFSLVILAGCISDNQKDKRQENNQLDNLQTTTEDQRPKWDENFLEAKLDDILAKQYVMVMGAENDDGSITADRIIIGNIETNFVEMTPLPPRINGDEENKDVATNSDRQPPSGIPDFQNMSDEEKAKLREQMIAQRGNTPRLEGTGNFRRGGSDQEISRIIGEVIKKDETSITIKLTEGGSKLVFFSDSTAVFKIK